MSDPSRINSFLANKIVFEKRIEELLSHCPNMTGEDDLREFCGNRCAAYYWCHSIEPAEVPIQVDECGASTAPWLTEEFDE
jgi:hypothetical protein